MPSDPQQGIDMQQLEETLQRWPVKTCWLMTTLQNPLGVKLSPVRKAQLVALLARYRVPLIEDDVYAELWAGSEPPHPAEYWDRDGGVLHCGSFSKCLVAGFRVGWVAAGQHAQRIQRLQLMSTLFYQRADAAGAGGLSRHASLRYAPEKAAPDAGALQRVGAPGAEPRAADRRRRQRCAGWLFWAGDAAAGL
nr:putative HTH-type transcriptional regulator YdcR [Candidatus Pantoea persica]